MTPQIRFVAIGEHEASAYRAGAADAYGLAPERRVSPGGYPCRHCLNEIGAGEDYLTLAYRPFPTLQPYAETGPIFLHGQACPRYAAAEILPPMLSGPDYIVRGYGADDRIVYGTGAVTPTAEIAGRAASLLTDPKIAYVHVRSARNNCYQCRIERRDNADKAA
ncbi:DUF1203 domain-containing protein [Rhizobium sp. AG855]|uniref:DUF1203 domain-containing protein n=1 Tax=Rhizobium sp. AG855 TaxID=2183898 RepID=UPI000E749286|nr:DUF1203 domain-containing protein [Rhizobium sp. AG855]RKE85016.1 uncharacterized protein DUF1203 [Rhizobium sp. AG855]